MPGSDKQQRVHQLDLAAIVSHQRRQPAANAQVDAGLGVDGERAIHVVALFVGDHLERQLIVIAQESCPLAVSAAARAFARECRRSASDLPRSTPMNSRGMSGK